MEFEDGDVSRAPREANEQDDMCVECTSQHAEVLCVQCQDSFCQVCFHVQHRKGKRAQHVTQRIGPAAAALGSSEGSGGHDDAGKKRKKTKKKKHKTLSPSSPKPRKLRRRKKPSKCAAILSLLWPFGSSEVDIHTCGEFGDWWGQHKPPPSFFEERAPFVPLRLPLSKRRYMRLVKAISSVCNYTGAVDSKLPRTAKAQAKRQHVMIKETAAALTGMAVATNYEVGQELLQGGDFGEHSGFFRSVLELARRHKIRNPDKMRSSYAKLMYLLQDSRRKVILEALEMDLVRPIQTAHTLLAKHNGLHILRDEFLPLATGEIIADGKSRAQVQRSIRLKEKAITHIARKYSNDQPRRRRRRRESVEDEDDEEEGQRSHLSEDEIRTVLLSFGDNHSYLRFNRDPCDVMLHCLQTSFSPDKQVDGPFSLGIKEGEDGARLTHGHAEQYHFVLQTLLLWREVLHNMYELWALGEADLLDPDNEYQLENTGQGLQRVQKAPRVTKAMHKILFKIQTQLKSSQVQQDWVGSSVLHLGDHNVPNALSFIDKYTQVPRILIPIVTCLRELPRLADENKATARYFSKVFGGVDKLRMTIMADFFRSAFDGSGADTFFSAGSCIDGRLTSAWNWCSELPKKPYYAAFLLSGFRGFDGDFYEGDDN